MTQKILPDDINPPERIGSILPAGEETKDFTGAASTFSSYMQKTSPVESSAVKSQMISPFDLAQTGMKNGLPSPSLGTIMSQVQLAQSTMGDLQSQLSYPGLKLKASEKYVVQNKLSDANTSFKAVNQKLGSPLAEPPTSEATGPLAKFLDYVSDGVNQMESAKRQIAQLKNKGHSLNPADFLLIQIKMNKAQQELDFTSVLVSKAVENFKTLMNIQL
jgi:flagellar hook-basal body complex protein FliE